MLATLQQKDISGIMTNLWQSDRSKAKWAILAKAYTLIRDKKGKVNAPLDGFLNINAPRMGIAKPSEYMNTLGWEIVLGSDGGAMLRRNPENDSSDSIAGASSNASVQDIIAHSYEHGYIDVRDGEIVTVPQNEAVLSMATSGSGIPPASDTSQVKDTNVNAGKGSPGSNKTPNGAAKKPNDAAQMSEGAQPPPGPTPPNNDGSTAGVDRNSMSYNPAAFDILLNNISVANPHVPRLKPGETWHHLFIPGVEYLPGFDPTTMDQHDAINMTKTPALPLGEFDINQWVNSMPPSPECELKLIPIWATANRM